MKTNWITILFVFVTVGLINLGSSWEFSNPNIKILAKNKISTEKGDIFIYTIKLKSSENLKQFDVTPSVLGSNIDCRIHSFFAENVYQAVVSYYYVLPNNVKEDDIEINFSLIDEKNNYRLREVISVE